MNKGVVTLDVRDDLAQGREPFGKIMRAVAGLGEDQDLLLIAPFEPAPLFHVLAQQGFSHRAKLTSSGDWEVLFTRRTIEPAEPQEQIPARKAPRDSNSGKRARSCAGTPVLEVDARGLEPPEPLVKILEAVSTLPDGVELRALTDRRPMHLYPRLEERGFVGESEEQSDGSFVTHVRRH